MDVETEKQIQEAIGRLIAGPHHLRHRAPAVARCATPSRLIVLDKGEIVGMGSHAELMAKQGRVLQPGRTQTAVNEIIGVGNV